jgi:putative transposase
MARIRRIIVNGHPYFITNITAGRHPLLISDIDLLWRAIESARNKLSFDLFAWVVLPEHFHFIINPDKSNISEILKKIKQIFGANFRKKHGLHSGHVWQSGFYDHIIRNEEDLEKHINYIHLNPVKHGLVSNPFDYPHSSITKFKDFYPPNWGVKNGTELEGDFGE